MTVASGHHFVGTYRLEQNIAPQKEDRFSIVYREDSVS